MPQTEQCQKEEWNPVAHLVNTSAYTNTAEMCRSKLCLQAKINGRRGGVLI